MYIRNIDARILIFAKSVFQNAVVHDSSNSIYNWDRILDAEVYYWGNSMNVSILYNECDALLSSRPQIDAYPAKHIRFSNLCVHVETKYCFSLAQFNFWCVFFHLQLWWFQSLDKDGSGELSPIEIQTALKVAQLEFNIESCRTMTGVSNPTLIARFKGLIWGPSGADRTQVGPMLGPWTLLSG